MKPEMLTAGARSGGNPLLAVVKFTRSTKLSKLKTFMLFSPPGSDSVMKWNVGVAKTGSGDLALYRVNARMLESFKGPSLKTLVFRQWIAGQAEDDATGEGVIVALHESEVDGSYFVLEGDSAFPDHENLLDAARNAGAR